MTLRDGRFRACLRGRTRLENANPSFPIGKPPQPDFDVVCRWSGSRGRLDRQPTQSVWCFLTLIVSFCRFSVRCFHQFVGRDDIGGVTVELLQHRNRRAHVSSERILVNPFMQSERSVGVTEGIEGTLVAERVELDTGIIQQSGKGLLKRSNRNPVTTAKDKGVGRNCSRIPQIRTFVA